MEYAFLYSARSRPRNGGAMGRLIYVMYLTDCLHLVNARPGHNLVVCPFCQGWHYAVELRKL